MAPRRAVKERLSREAVASFALALADAEGLEAVTIRRVAADAGVTPMALYWHFADKDALLGGVAELVLAQISLPADDPSRPWDDRLSSVLGVLLDALRTHPAVVDVVKGCILEYPAGLDLTERVLGLLAEAGYTTDEAAAAAVYALVALIGLVTSQPGSPLGAAEDDELREQRVRTKKAALQVLSPKQYPNLVAAADALTDCAVPDAYFEQGLDLLVAGIRGFRGRVGAAGS